MQSHSTIQLSCWFDQYNSERSIVVTVVNMRVKPKTERVFTNQIIVNMSSNISIRATRVHANCQKSQTTDVWIENLIH